MDKMSDVPIVVSNKVAFNVIILTQIAPAGRTDAERLENARKVAVIKDVGF